MEIITRPEVIVLLGLWLVPHFLLLNIVRSSNDNWTPTFCLLLLVAAYLLKPSTSDLPLYSVYFSTGFVAAEPYKIVENDVILDPKDSTGEPFEQAFPHNKGFQLLAKYFNKILPKGPFLPRINPVQKRYITDLPILLVFMIGLGISLITTTTIIRTNRLDTTIGNRLLRYLPLILGSVYFLLGSQNVIRQFLGSIFILWSFSLILNNRSVLATITTLIAISLHHWSAGFAVWCLIVWYLLNSFQSRNKELSFPFGSWQAVTIGFFLGCGLLLFTELLLLFDELEGLNSFFTVPLFFADIPRYGVMNLGENLIQTPTTIKIIAIGFLLIISELVMGHEKKNEPLDIRSLRAAAYMFALPLAFYPDLISRYLFFYFGIEMLYMCWGISSNQKRSQLAALIVFIGHGFAPNAINVLIGPEWLYSFS